MNKKMMAPSNSQTILLFSAAVAEWCQRARGGAPISEVYSTLRQVKSLIHYPRHLLDINPSRLHWEAVSDHRLRENISLHPNYRSLSLWIFI